MPRMGSGTDQYEGGDHSVETIGFEGQRFDINDLKPHIGGILARLDAGTLQHRLTVIDSRHFVIRGIMRDVLTGANAHLQNGGSFDFLKRGVFGST